MKTICFYLPQFHPVPENDEWWGKGFTEWTNVVKAKPRFKGHHQPQLPADLGFYDLRLKETRIAQAELAKMYGISGFCYYHYWFNGKRILEQPFDEVLSSGAPDFPFCLCWANESWTKNWTGLNKHVLLEQTHSEDDDLLHIDWLIRAFKDVRYIKVQNKPLLLIYRIDLIPHVQKMLQLWRNKAKINGFSDLYLVAVKNNFVKNSAQAIIDLGFDGVVEFQPNSAYFPHRNPLQKIKNKVKRKTNVILGHLTGNMLQQSFYVSDVYDYRKFVDKAIKGLGKSGKVFPTVIPGWDNSARRRDGARIIQNDDPALYANWLSKAIESVKRFDSEEQLVFINAWNEWAEGCKLEPDARNGRKFLEATRDAISKGVAS
ncbi:glycosyltransferase WbsX family protein [Pelotalea chapellei]|uniref:Glycoside hydrolase family 99-like domain-containing protein n=1 Tax=Pelotalea chapellei TaxID=44671 RepID=A0ABS5U6T0_9BACT|nr:glycoside hydrolase family 99-like domain-containing protein [Pelotalea chapellei]MBT1071368.1 glycoside hydrolase family 99-like domain-containing protein [Pelotalea chapellei]